MADTPFPSASANVPDAGWYPDPAGSGALRWWDGKGWTDHVRPDSAGSPIAPSAGPSAGASTGPSGGNAGTEVPWWAKSEGDKPPSWWEDVPAPTPTPVWSQSNTLRAPEGASVPYATPKPSSLRPRADGAVRSLVLGLLSVLCCGILGPFAIYAGVNTRFRIRVSNGRLSGDGMAIAGIFFGAVGTLFWLYGTYRAATGRPVLPTTSTG